MRIKLFAALLLLFPALAFAQIYGTSNPGVMGGSPGVITESGPRSLYEQATDPTNLANTGFIYSKDDAGDTELFYIDDSGNVVQMTENGSIPITLLVDDVDLTFGTGEDLACKWSTNGTGDDLFVCRDKKLSANDTAAIWLARDLDPANMTAFDNYLSPTLVFVNDETADAGDFAAVVMGPRTASDVTNHWYFDFLAMNGAADGVLDASADEEGPLFRFGDTPVAASYVNDPGDVIFNGDIEIDGIAYFDSISYFYDDIRIDTDDELMFGGLVTLYMEDDTSDDRMIFSIPVSSSDETGAFIWLRDQSVSGMTDFDDFPQPNLVMTNDEAADEGDYAALVIGPRTTADVTAAWYFDLFATTGSFDGSVNGTATELAPIIRIGNAGTATTDHGVTAGGVLFEDDIEVDGTASFDGAVSLGSTTTISGAIPTLTFDDTDTTVETSDATIFAQATDAVTAQEDVDVTFTQQVHSAITNFLVSDADGDITVGRAGQNLESTGRIHTLVGAAEALRLSANADDYVGFTLDANGGMAIKSIDDNAAAANISVTADGTYAVTSTGYNLTGAGAVSGLTTITNGGLISNTVGAAEGLRLSTNADDYVKFTMDANGGLAIESIDDNAAAANIAITADGQFSVASTGIDISGAGAISSVTTLNTGQGANELYAMNQDVESTDDVTFGKVITTEVEFAGNMTLDVADDVADKFVDITNSGTQAAGLKVNGVEIVGADSEVNAAAIEDAFLHNNGDTGTGDYDLTGAILLGATPLVLEGATDNTFQLNLAVADIATPTKTATFQDFTGYVVMNVNAVTDLEGTALSVGGGTLNVTEADPLSATKALDNLASVAISESLVSDAASTDDLGTEAIYWQKLFLDAEISFEGATDDDYQTTFSVTDPTTVDKTITFQDADGIVAMDDEAITDLAGTKLSVTGTTLNVTETDSVVGAVTGIVKADGGGNISAAVAGTDYPPVFDYTDVIFLGKHGNDSNDGLSPGAAKLTLAAAITTANALTPAADNRIEIRCNDSGIYTEDVNIIASYVHLYAPSATFASTTTNNTLQIEDEASLVAFEVIQNTGGPAAIVGANNAGDRWIVVERVTATGSAIGLINFAVTSDGIMNIEVGNIDIEEGIAVSDNSADGHIHLDVLHIDISGNSGIGVYSGGDGLIAGQVDHIVETGTPSTTVGLDVAMGTVSLLVGEIVTDTVYDVTAGATLNLNSALLTGTRVNAGTANIVNAAGASTVPTLGDNADITKQLTYDLSGATTAKKMTLASSHTDARTVTLPDADVTLNAAGDLSGATLSSNVLASSLTSVGTIASLVATTADINAGTFDGTIGGTTPAVGSFTTVDSEGIIQTGKDGTDGLFKIYSEEGGTDQFVSFAPHADMTEDTPYILPAADGTVNQVLKTDGSFNLSWATPAGTGASTALDNLASVAINESLISDGNNTDDLGSDALEWKDLWIDGTAYLDAVDIDGGAIDGATIGGVTPAAASFTDATVKHGILTVGASNEVGAEKGQIVLHDGNDANLHTLTLVTPNLGASYSLTLPTADGSANYFLKTNGGGALSWAGVPNLTLSNLNGTAFAVDVDPSTDGVRDLGNATHEWKDLYIDGIANIDSLIADTADINAGTIDGTAIGGGTPAAASFTTLLVGSDANFPDFANAQAVISQGNTAATNAYNSGLVVEGVADGTNEGVGLQGFGKVLADVAGYGVYGEGKVTNSADTASAGGVIGVATDEHTGGDNVGVYGYASGASEGNNYSFFGIAGTLYNEGDAEIAGTLTGITTAITGTQDTALTISVPTATAAGQGITIVADAAGGAQQGGILTLSGAAGTPNGYVRIGTTGAPTFNLGIGLFSANSFEVDGTLYADGLAYFSDDLHSGEELVIGTGTGGNDYSNIRIEADDGTHFALNMGDGYDNGHLIFTTNANKEIDHDHESLSTNPTIFIHSALDPDTSNNQWGSFSHDQENFVITTGANEGEGTTDNNGVLISPSVLTESGGTDYALRIDRTLNDSDAASGTDYFTGLLMNITKTDDTGWDAINLINLQTDDASKFQVDDDGNVYSAGAHYISEMSTPSAVADFGAIYPKDDNKAYFQDGAGDEHTISLDAAWVDYSDTSTITSFSSYTVKEIWYLKEGNKVYVKYDIQGVSNSALDPTFTLPDTSANTVQTVAMVRGRDNGTVFSDPSALLMLPNSATVKFYTTLLTTSNQWTASGNKAVQGQFFYDL